MRTLAIAAFLASTKVTLANPYHDPGAYPLAVHKAAMLEMTALGCNPGETDKRAISLGIDMAEGEVLGRGRDEEARAAFRLEIANLAESTWPELTAEEQAGFCQDWGGLAVSD